MRLDGVDATNWSSRRLRNIGLGIVPDDRQKWGLILGLTVGANLALTGISRGKWTRYGLLQRRKIAENANALIQAYDVRPPDPNARVRTLSGGNQQKVVLARELSTSPKVLVVAQPTSGLDVGAASYVHTQLLSARDRGIGILLVSNDLDELLNLSDRVAILSRGQIAYEAQRGDLDFDRLAAAMAGSGVGATPGAHGID
jgi:simple sugar transport system ATP-binding protein